MESIPTVYCVVPVYNRLEITKRFLAQINEQDYPAVHLIIVDDGSTDGTGEYITQISQSNLTILKGDGNLWWSGAMHLGMAYVISTALENDYLLMLNDDVCIERGYISTLIKESKENSAAVIGSIQRDELSGALLCSGYNIDFWKMRYIPVTSNGQNLEVDALPGRGVLYPMHVIRKAGNVNTRLFPHYLADIEYTFRISEMGFRVLISKSAYVLTLARPSNPQEKPKGNLSVYFSSKSARNLLHRLLFFCLHGPIILRLLAVPRYPFMLLKFRTV